MKEVDTKVEAKYHIFVRERIKRVILEVAKKEGIKVLQIILFGSRARGQARPDSDWDILVVVDGALGREREKSLFTAITAALAEEGIDSDIIIKAKQQAGKASSPFIMYILKEGQRVYG